jgi:hypothetical protein
MSFFASAMGKVLIGATVNKGAELASNYLSDTIFSEDSFLGSTFDKYLGKFNPFGESSPIVSATGEVVKAGVAAGAKQMLSQGLGVDPRTGQNMPSINVPEGNTFSSRNKNFGKGNYAGLPQGSYKILDNAFKDQTLNQIAFDYKQARMPNVKVASGTVSMGSSTIGNLDKGIIKGVKN